MDRKFPIKINIISICDNYNHGNRLQNFALQYFVQQNLGICQSTWWKKEFLNRVNISLYSVKTFIKYLINWKNFRKKQQNAYVYDGIREFNISRFTYGKIDIADNNRLDKSCNANFDYFVVGSDQVWNPNFWGDRQQYENAYFLKFADKNKRIAYAASFGINELPKEYEESFKEGLNGIPYISVREHAGAAIVKKLAGRDVPVLVDPTLLLSDKEWRSIEMRPDWYRDEKYILTYFLGNVPQVLDELAKKHNYKIYNLMDADNLNLYTSRVEEFLWLIDHAELVCTDSFQACVFSIIFNTPFVVVKRQQKGMADMTSRLDTLLGLFGYQNRLIDFVKASIKADELLHMDFSKVKDIQKREMVRSTDFLKKAMKME